MFELCLFGYLPSQSLTKLKSRLNGLCSTPYTTNLTIQTFHTTISQKNEQIMIRMIRPITPDTENTKKESNKSDSSSNGFEVLKIVGTPEVNDAYKVCIRNVFSTPVYGNIRPILLQLGYKLVFEKSEIGLIYKYRDLFTITITNIQQNINKEVEEGSEDEGYLLELFSRNINQEEIDQMYEEIQIFREYLKGLVKLEKVNHRVLAQKLES